MSYLQVSEKLFSKKFILAASVVGLSMGGISGCQSKHRASRIKSTVAESHGMESVSTRAKAPKRVITSKGSAYRVAEQESSVPRGGRPILKEVRFVQAFDDQKPRVVIVSKAPVYKGPGTNFPVVDYLLKNMEVTPLGREGVWLRLGEHRYLSTRQTRLKK